MKKIFQIVLLLFSATMLGCTCDPPKITEKYIQSDFVAKVKIIKNYKNENSRELYKADIIISELFKGERLKSIFVSGRSDRNIGSSCSIFIPENTELIIYASKNKDGKFTIGICSGLLYLSKSRSKSQNRELEILRTFKEKKIVFTDKINYREKSNFDSDLQQFKGIELNKSFGLYEIVFADDLTIKTVAEISGFGNGVDQKLIEIIKKSKWSSFNNGIKDKIPDNSKLIFGVYFYPKHKNYLSFLSQLYL